MTKQKSQDERVSETPWSIVEISWSYMRVRAATRTLTATRIFVSAGLGIRSIATLPRQAVAPAPIASMVPIDASVAASAARAAVRDWLYLDSPQACQARPVLIWKKPGKAGWSSQGTANIVSELTVMAIAVRNPRRIDVIIAVSVVASKADGEEVPHGQLGMHVPIQVANGAAPTVGGPTIAELPRPRAAIDEEPFDNDSEITAATKTGIERSLAAQAAGNTSAAATPRASISVPPRGLIPAVFVGWRVHDGDGDTCIGKAKVAVKSGEAEITSTYTITFTKVIGGTATRWQTTHIN